MSASTYTGSAYKTNTFSISHFALQVDREFRVLSALHSVSFPVPKPYLYCEDVSIIGTEFYVMEHVKVKTESNYLMNLSKLVVLVVLVI